MLARRGRLAWVSTSACEPGVRSQKLPAYSNREVEIRRGRIGNETLQDITTVHSCPICSWRFWRPSSVFSRSRVHTFLGLACGEFGSDSLTFYSS